MPPETYSLGLIGFPLGHSFSPQIHGAALHALGMSGEYSLYPVAPHPSRTIEGGRLTLEGLLEQMKTGEIHGLNVTIPHKQNVIPLLDELTPAAETIGAVNTIFVQENKLIGDNTDAHGFWGDLKRLAVSDQQSSSSALVLGAGGSRCGLCPAHPRLPRHHHSPTDRTSAKTLQSVVSNQCSVIHGGFCSPIPAH